MKKLLLLTLFVVCFSCEDDDNKYNLKAGIATKISGEITDEENKPFVNVRILVNEYKKGGVMGMGEFVKIVDSVFTNSEGKYEKTFYTTGAGREYRLSITGAPILTQDYFGDVRDVVINNIGKSFTYNHSFIRLYPCDITINTENTTIFPLLISQGTTNMNHYQNNDYQILEKGIVTKRFYLAKNFFQPIDFYRTVSSTKSQRASYILEPIKGAGNYPQVLRIEDKDFND